MDARAAVQPAPIKGMAGDVVRLPAFRINPSGDPRVADPLVDGRFKEDGLLDKLEIHVEARGGLAQAGDVNITQRPRGVAVAGHLHDVDGRPEVVRDAVKEEAVRRDPDVLEDFGVARGAQESRDLRIEQGLATQELDLPCSQDPRQMRQAFLEFQQAWEIRQPVVWR